ncbi:hypothetical protein BH10BDE1_BH10BDE1_27940 [soil metagenome]
MDEKKKRAASVKDRVVIANESLCILKRLTEQIAEQTNGMLRIQNRELTNFLIQERGGDISADELTKLRARYFDDLKAMKWVVDELRKAKSKSEDADLLSLLKQAQVQDSGKSSAVSRKARQPRVSAKTAPAPTQEADALVEEQLK